MLLHTTEIDTIALQINCGNDAELQRSLLADMLKHIKNTLNPYIDPVEYYAGIAKSTEYKIYCNARTVTSFKTGYSHNNYYISIKFAGLKTYDYTADETSSCYLWVIVAYINTKQIRWSLSEMDIAIDVRDVDFRNLLAVCTSHTSRTQYHCLGEIQRYDGETTYIEKFETDGAKSTAIKRAYIYNKTLKEWVKHGNALGFNLQRFEIKLQAGYFNKYSFDINMLASSLYMYHLLYFENVVDKDALIGRYNSYSNVRQREIDRMGLERYRLYFDIDYINNFIFMLTNTNNNDIFDIRTLE